MDFFYAVDIGAHTHSKVKRWREGRVGSGEFFVRNKVVSCLEEIGIWNLLVDFDADVWK